MTPAEAAAREALPALTGRGFDAVQGLLQERALLAKAEKEALATSWKRLQEARDKLAAETAAHNKTKQEMVLLWQSKDKLSRQLSDAESDTEITHRDRLLIASALHFAASHAAQSCRKTLLPLHSLTPGASHAVRAVADLAAVAVLLDDPRAETLISSVSQALENTSK